MSEILISSTGNQKEAFFSSSLSVLSNVFPPTYLTMKLWNNMQGSMAAAPVQTA